MFSARRPWRQSDLADDPPRAVKIEIGAQKKSLAAGERNNRKPAAFRHKIAERDGRKFVFVDEMGANLSVTRLYGLANPACEWWMPCPAQGARIARPLAPWRLMGCRRR